MSLTQPLEDAVSAGRALRNEAALVDALDRVEHVIDAETAALRGLKVVDLRDFNNRKSRGLLDLTRAIRALDGAELDAVASARLKILRAKLEANQAVLSMHLAAAREITQTVARAIRDAESDGTYSNARPSQGKAPW